MSQADVTVVGAGPNGLACAIALAQAGLKVLVLEANQVPGGGLRSDELTLPGFVHDLCSAVHPLAASSPFFKSLELERHGLRMIQPPAPLAQAMSPSQAVVVERSLEATAAALGSDGAAYRELLSGLVDNWNSLSGDFLSPMLRLPRSPLLMARFGLRALRSAEKLGHDLFETEAAKALFAGHAAHAMVPLSHRPTAAIALVLAAAAHAVGWPIIEGGSQKLADALAKKLAELGGTIQTGVRVESLSQLSYSSRAIVFDLTPRQILAICRDSLSPSAARALERYQHGMAAYKLDWALDAPIPWKNPALARAGTVHIGASSHEISAGEEAAWRGNHSERPFVLLSQPTLFDSTRAPKDRHVAWAYCHVPLGSSFDMTSRIEDQVERLAPGFKGTILKRAVAGPRELERRNANLVGGDIGGGAATLEQVLFRPRVALDPYQLPTRSSAPARLFICSAATPPGAGVHGMCGFHAARSVLRTMR